MSPEEMSSIMILTRIPKLGWVQLLCAGGADVKMVSALPTALHADQPDDAGHFFSQAAPRVLVKQGFEIWRVQAWC